MELSRLERFYRFHAKFYDATRWLFLLDRKKAIDLLEVEPGDVIVDFGCGTGLNVPHLLRRDAEITGVDYSESMLHRARAKFPLIRFVQGDMSTYEFSEAADGIICTYSLSMVENWKRAVLNMTRNLRDTGILVILDFCPFTGMLRFLNPVWGWWLRMHGVDMNQEVIPLLRGLFEHVEANTRRYGYNYVVAARLPKPVPRDPVRPDISPALSSDEIP